MDRWFDAHLDLAYLALMGRDLIAGGPSDPPHPPAAVTLPWLAEGNVVACLGTIFTEADGADGPISYPASDADAALDRGLRQLEVYRDWFVAGLAAPLTPGEAVVGGRSPGAGKLQLGILIEGADPIRGPDDLEWWARWGVIAVGMAWYKPSRYAGGNGTDLGISDLGRQLVRAIDELGIVHDASHLSDNALAELFELTDARIIASHSNSRALMGDPANQRHLTDETIREIDRRGGIIGLNLFSKFLRPGLSDGGRASVDDCVRHIEHVCELVGHRRAVGLGSDMDGGFGATALPSGIDRPRDLEKIAAALSSRGWNNDDITDFAWGNWAQFWGIG
ncbi:MAG: membrane dipeptidase [Phycisphaerales bacterium]|nr:membrane dipeptidase [Phycisphaerales bacterium]